MDKVKSFLHKHAHPSRPPQSNQPPPPPAPSSLTQGFPNDQDLYRYRKQRGVNLGLIRSWFVLERWIADGPYCFAAQPGQSDHDVAKGSSAEKVLEHHWDSWFTEDDWKWISERGLNTVRIPVGSRFFFYLLAGLPVIGFYHLCGADPSVLVGTDFAEHYSVFRGAWVRITNAITTAHRYGIGVLIDLHAAPGKQNADAHSGTSSSDIAFYTASNMSRTTQILLSLLTHLTTFTRTHDPPLPNLVGIELLNEPNPPGGDHTALKKWYKMTIAALQTVDPTLPLYIGDSWRTQEYAEFIGSLEPATPAFLVLDHHLYRCFTQQDAATPAAQHAQALRSASPFGGAPGTLASAGGGLVVGEWSGALNPGSLHGVHDEDAEKRAFVDAQMDVFERECAGWFWWTFKKQHGGDSGWAMRDAVARGVFPGWVSVKVRAGTNLNDDGGREARRDHARDGALGAHSGWWSQYPGHYQHWRFGEGFVRGWDDAYTFFSSTGTATAGGVVSEIGFKGAWAKRRAAEHVRERGEGNIWEFEVLTRDYSA
ncbi:hypothetical protein EW146_g9442 [Bondarzewia mesenterica]|uniref:Glycoside hydrolase family 5 domain-containing protein n=1 Tax=Bondarzewia mesenterica TaxID=1095465 RepID=A0A4S4L7T1_9AGAM|nr:hypothetical protein EW146_g9442 [Bondarzewia mesenterica]